MVAPATVTDPSLQASSGGGVGGVSSLSDGFTCLSAVGGGAQRSVCTGVDCGRFAGTGGNAAHRPGANVANNVMVMMMRPRHIRRTLPVRAKLRQYGALEASGGKRCRLARARNSCAD